MQALGITPSTNVVALANESWNHNKTTLSGAAEALIQIIVEAATAGAGDFLSEALISSTTFGDAAIDAAVDAAGAGAAGAGSASSAASMLAYATGISYPAATALTTASTAFTSSLISGSIIGGANGNFNFARILENAAASGLSAGLTSGVNSLVFGADAPTLASVLRNGSIGSLTTDEFNKMFLTSIGETLIDSPIQAGVYSMLTGANFGQGLLSDLRSNAASDIITPILMSEMGDFGKIIYRNQNPNGTAGEILLHALAGAGGGAIAGGARGALGGAFGGAISEAAFNIPGLLTSNGQPTDTGAQLSQILGSLGSLLANDPSLSGATAGTRWV